MKLYVNTNTMIKSVKLAELSVKIVIAFLDEQCLLIEYNNCNKNY